MGNSPCLIIVQLRVLKFYIYLQQDVSYFTDGPGVVVVVGVVIVIIIVIVVLHHFVAVLLAEQAAADERVPVAGHQLRLAFRARKTLDVVNAAA